MLENSVAGGLMSPSIISRQYLQSAEAKYLGPWSSYNQDSSNPQMISSELTRIYYPSSLYTIPTQLDQVYLTTYPASLIPDMRYPSTYPITQGSARLL